MENKQSFEHMILQLKQMSSLDIEKNLRALGCETSYDDIVKQLLQTWNDLRIGDKFFRKYEIKENETYPISFIDEAILEIARRETFPFVHYGLIVERVQHNKASTQKAYIENMLFVFDDIFALAKAFHITSLESMVYEVQDETDMLVELTNLLEELILFGHSDTSYDKILIRFVDTYEKVFKDTSPMIKNMLSYQKATAYIACQDARGDRIFKQLIKCENDKTDVIFHYALSYLDDDEKKALRIFRDYKHLLDKKSDAYQYIEDIIRDSKQ